MWRLAVSPVLVVGWPTGGRTLPVQRVVVGHNGRHEVVGLHGPPAGEGTGPRVLLAEVGVVRHGVLLRPGPDIPAHAN
jgi:hypothetical protein